MLSLALLGSTTSRPPDLLVLLVWLSVELRPCTIFLPGPFAPENVTFSLPIARCFCFQLSRIRISWTWFTDVFADHFLLPVFVWIPAPAIVPPAESRNVIIPCGIWLPWIIPPQWILVSVNEWSCWRVRSMLMMMGFLPSPQIFALLSFPWFRL